ncbi:MAG: phosphotransferase [Oligoflexales bacterium]
MVVIPADIDIDEEIAMSAISNEFSLSVDSIKLLGEGWDNLVFLVNEAFVFRFSRRKVAIPLIEREIRVLAKVASKLPLAIPQPQYCSRGTEVYPHAFYGHRIIPGVTGCQIDFQEDEYKAAASKLGMLLSVLHGVDLAELRSVEDPMVPVFDRTDTKQMFATFDQRFDSVCKTFLSLNTETKISEIKNAAKNYRSDQSKSSLVHGDLYHRHLVFNGENKLTGVIDWGDCCISDPVVDLGVVYQFLPLRVHTHFWNAYGEVSLEARNYARFLGLYSAIALLWFGHDRGDKRLVDTALNTVDMI